MTFIPQIATFLEMLKFKHPKYFLLVQSLLFGTFIAIQTHPEIVLQIMPQNLMTTIETVLVALGFSISSGTTKFLPESHKKVQEIKNPAE